MSAHVPKPPKSLGAFAAVLSLDPAAVADCGLAVRSTAGLDRNTQRGRLRAPDYLYEGSVWSTTMHDELADWLYRNIPDGGRLLIVVENSAFRGAARHLGRAIGCIEGLCSDLNVADPGKTQYLAPNQWRKTEFPIRAHGRDEWKALAVDTVSTLYGMTCSDNQAEAVLMNDHVIHAKPSWWLSKKAK